MKNQYYWFILCFVLINCYGKTSTKENNTETIIAITEENKTISTIEKRSEHEDEVSKYIIDELSYNFDNGNGTILNYNIENEYLIITRKHETRLFLMAFMQQYIVYEDPYINSNELFVITSSCYVNTLQIVFVKNLNTNEAMNWIKIITDDNIAGWLKVSTNKEIYSEGNWAILEIININNKNWTIRKIRDSMLVIDFSILNRENYIDYQGIILYDSIDIRNNPGIDGTEIIFTIKMEDDKRVPLKILAITEETDSKDGEIEHWLKIEFEDGRIGWIFGGYVYNLADPRYFFPNSILGIYLM
jgi:hypothetical protein